MTPAQSPAARKIARSLLTREIAGATDAAAVAAAMQRVCVRVSANLRRSVGDDGSNALLARALRAVEPEHTVLTAIRRVDGEGIYLDNVVASVDAHGVPVVTAALESVLAAVADLLGSLIGADMVLNILDGGDPISHTLSGTETS